MLGLQIVYIIFSGNSGAWGKINDKYCCVCFEIKFISFLHVKPRLSVLSVFICFSFLLLFHLFHTFSLCRVNLKLESERV